MDKIEIRDEIQVKGVGCMGHGSLAVVIMFCRLLSLYAKAIYAYMVSYTGAGHNTLYPGRDRILAELKISKSAYYDALSELTSNGLITITKIPSPPDKNNPNHNKTPHNLYTVEDYCALIDDIDIDKCSNIYADKLALVRKHNSIYAGGYGDVHRAVMIDTRIKAPTKGVYAFFACSSASKNEIVMRPEDVAYYLDISDSTLQKHVKKLVSLGYMSVYQHRNNGRYDGKMVYIVNQKTAQHSAKKQDAQKQDTQKQDTQKQDMQKQDAQKSDKQKQDMRKQDTNSSATYNSPKILSATNFSQPQSVTVDSATDADNDISNLSIEDRMLLVNDEIKQQMAIPYWYADDANRLIAAVSLITEAYCYDNKDYYSATSAFGYDTYVLFKSALTDMLTAGVDTSIKGRKINYSHVIQLLNGYLHVDNCGYICVPDFTDSVCNSYIQATSLHKVTSHLGYMKTIIWTVLSQGITTASTADANYFARNTESA